MAIKFNPSIVTNGLVGCLDAADLSSYSSGSATWSDMSTGHSDFVFQNDAATKNIAHFTDDKGLLMDGSDDFLLGANASGGFQNGLNTGGSNGNFTFDIWFKFNAGDSNASGAGIIGTTAVSDGDIHSANGFNVHLTVDGSNNLKVFTFNGGGAEDTDTGFNVATGEIAHVGMVHNALTSRAGFKNGELSTFVSKWSTQNFANIVLAGDHSEGGSFLAHAHSNITYYCVKLYNRALSAKEVKQNYDALRGRFGV